MSDFIKRTLIDGAILGALVSILGLLIKQWISKAIEHQFSRALEEKKAEIEFEKQKGLSILEKQNAVYPEIVELAYRLRNKFRDRLEELNNDARDSIKWNKKPNISEFGEDLYLFTENLYKYRVYIDEKVFKNLHKIKRDIQDAEVLFDIMNRANPPGSEENFVKRYNDSIGRLTELFNDVDDLYPKICKNVKEHMHSVLNKQE